MDILSQSQPINTPPPPPAPPPMVPPPPSMPNPVSHVTTPTSPPKPTTSPLIVPSVSNTPPPPPPPDQIQNAASHTPKKRKLPNIALAVILLLILSIPISAYFISQSQQLTDLRSRAAYPTTRPTGTGPIPTGSSSANDYGGRAGVWGRYGNDCDRSGTTVICTGNNVRIYTCSPSEIKSWSQTGAPICTSHLQNTSGTFDCVALANQTCSFVQIDVDIPSNPVAGSAVTCYPTQCSTNPAPIPTPTNKPPEDVVAPPPPPGPTSPPPNPTNPPPNPTATTKPTNTPTRPPASQCQNIKVYKNNALVTNLSTLKAGDQVVLGVKGANATKGRFRINGAPPNFQETTGVNSSGEFTLAFTIPSGTTNFQIEAEVKGQDGVWK